MSERPRVLVTRTANQAQAFSQKLLAAGFTPVEFPTIRLEPLPSEELDAALASLSSFDWLVFTSGNAVDFFLQRVDECGLVVNEWPKVAVVGSATAAKLSAWGIPISFMPEAFVGTELVAGLGDLAGKKVLLPRAKIGRPEITDMLQDQGAKLTEVPLYDTVTAVPDAGAFAEFNKGFAAITFTSPSSVRNFFIVMADYGSKLSAPLDVSLSKALVVCIGPVTATAAAKAGLNKALMPAKYTIDGMVLLLTAVLRKSD